MNAVDLKNAFESRDADNFTVLLLRLMLKSDRNNLEKLKLSFPVEVTAVKIYKSPDCKYIDGSGDVDYEWLSSMAHGIVEQEVKTLERQSENCSTGKQIPVQNNTWNIIEKAWW